MKGAMLIKKMFNVLSSRAVLAAKKENVVFKKIWEVSIEILPNLENHFTGAILENEALLRVRHLLCGEACFLDGTIRELFPSEKRCSYLDIGDSDGSVRLILNKIMDGFQISSLGINLQTKAVENIRRIGLDAECVDAMEIGKRGEKYDIVSLFETLEHLPNPIGFLESIHDIVGERLIISVPLISTSRVGMQYLSKKWPKDEIPTIENTHIFELSPMDWEKIFIHTGWKIKSKWQLRQFPKRGLLKFIMKYAWRKISFEGFWFVALSKDESSGRPKYRIES